MSAPEWYKDAVIYSLDVETFQDADGDGVGDFRGLIGRLDYLCELGVTCLWLLPFYPTPNRDDGYDVANYYEIDHRLGTLDDFDDFIEAAGRCGLRVIADLVVHHTSIEHPWFREARRDPSSPYRKYYVWSAEKPDAARYTPAFPGQQREVWTRDDVAGSYYRHRFYRHQPDLDTTEPAVREEIRRVMGFWLDRGVSGFRIDAAHFLPRPEAHAEESPEISHGLIWEMRRYLDEHHRDAVLMAEADVPEDRILDFFGDDDQARMVLNFLLNQSIFLAMARAEAGPIADRLRSLPGLPPSGQWANFIRNHDELTLGRLERRRARRGPPRLRPRRADADLRPRHPPSPAAAGRRRPPPARARLQPPADPARDAGPPLRRGDRHGRRPRAARPERGPDGDAVVRRPQRRLLDSPAG